MAIVTKLLEMMDSELHVTSEYGKGSSFSFAWKGWMLSLHRAIAEETRIY